MANATTVILMQKTLSYTAGTHLTTHLDLETGCMGRSRSLKMAPFDRPYTTLYWTTIVKHWLLLNIPKSDK